MYKFFLVNLLIISLVFTPLLTLAKTDKPVFDNGLLELAALLPESELMVTIDSEQMLNSAIPNLLNNNSTKLKKLETLIETVEEYTAIDAKEIRHIAIGYNFSDEKARKLTPNLGFTAIVRMKNSNPNLIENWAKKYDEIYRFEKEKSITKPYILSFKQFNKEDYSDSKIEKRKIYLAKIKENIQKVQLIGKQLKTLPKTASAIKIIAEHKKITEYLENYLDTFQPDIAVGKFPERTKKLIEQWNKIEISDKDRTAKLNQILTESKVIYPEYAKKYDSSRKSGNIISTAEIFDASEDSFANLTFFDRTNTALSKISTSLTRAVNRPRNLEDISEEIEKTSETISNLQIDSYSNTPFDKPEIDRLQKLKLENFYIEMLKFTKIETINSKKFISVDMKPFFEMKDEENSAEKKDYAKLGVGFVDDKTLVFGASEAVSDILKRDISYKNQRAVELLSFSPNPLVAFASDSILITKNTPKKKDEKNQDDKAKVVKIENPPVAVAENPDKSKENPTVTGDPNKKSQSEIGETDKKPQTDEAIEDDESSKYSPFGGFFDFLKSSDIYGSLNYDSANQKSNDISLSLGLIWHKQEDDLLLPDGEIGEVGDLGNKLEVAGFQIGKELIYDLLKTFKGVQATLVFKFEKEKVADLILSVPEIINDDLANKSHNNETAKNNRKVKTFKLNNLQQLLVEPKFYSDILKSF